MRAERRAKLDIALSRVAGTAAVLLGTTNVRWATGARVVASDQGRGARMRNVAVAVSGDPMPHLFTHTPEGVPADHPADHVHPGLDLETDAGAGELLAFVADHVQGKHERVLLDEWTMPLRRGWRSRLAGVAVDDAAVNLMSEARLIKTGDELACIRAAQRLNENAMLDVYPALRPRMRQCDLSGLFLRRVFELGADQNTVDPIWEVMPDSVAAGPRSVTGDVVFPTVTTDRVLEQGDVIWVDTGVTLAGYDSDFGRTWIVGADPTSAQRDQFHRWRDVVDAVLAIVRPGVTGGDLTLRCARRDRGDRGDRRAGRGCRTSIWRTASASTARRHRSSEPTSAPSSTRASCSGREWCSSSSRSCGPMAPAATAVRRSSP